MSQDIIRDSSSIRRQGCKGLMSCDPTVFRLPEDAETSEVNAKANNPEDLLRYVSFKKKQKVSKDRVKAIKGLGSWRK